MWSERLLYDAGRAYAPQELVGGEDTSRRLGGFTIGV